MFILCCTATLTLFAIVHGQDVGPCSKKVMEIEKRKYQPPGDQPPLMFIPECLSDGTYAAKQCTDTFCYCSSTTGEKLIADIEIGKAEDMDCECTRVRELMESQGLKDYNVLRCDSRGNFVKKQCFHYCVCVDYRNGSSIANSPVVPMAESDLLVCE